MIDKNSITPMYIQIVKYFELQIYKEIICENQVLPSIRETSEKLEVSVITSKKAYEELIKKGIITSIPRRGYIVKKGSQNYIRRIKKKELNNFKLYKKMNKQYKLTTHKG